MINPNMHPAYILVDYAWAVLSTNMPQIWDKSKYDDIIPIIPLSQEPELDKFDLPYIVYGFSDDMTGEHWARSGGAITFAIYDQNFRNLTTTLNVLRAALERQDETARDVNNFSTKFDPTGDEKFPYLGIRFGTIELAFSEGGTPEETEGGSQSAVVNARYEYYADYDVISNV